MAETTQETPSPEEIREELEREITAAALELETQEAPDALLLINRIALAIADAYSKAGNDRERKEIDNIVSSKLAELKLLPSDEDFDTKEQLPKIVLELELYKKVAHLLAGKLRSKPDEKEAVVTEAREQLQ